MEDEKEPKQPSQLAYEEGEDFKSSDKKCYRSNNGVSVELQH
jgi:hypothetical protein